MKNPDLRQQRRALLDSIPDMAWLKDRESRYLAVNTTYLLALDLREEELLGRRPDEIWPPDIAKVYLATDAAVLASGRPRRYEETRRRPHGGMSCFETIKAPIRDAHGNIVGTVGISRDISERKAAENELVESRAKLRALYDDLQKVREEERKRIARELHDQLGQTLTAMKLDLTWLSDHSADRSRNEIARIRRLVAVVDRSVADLKRIASDLHPLILDELGLVPAMHWLVDTVASHSGLRITLSFDREDLSYDPEVSTAIFRITQEALTNIVRHSGAHSVTVNARHANHDLGVEIIDDGCGMPSAEPRDCSTHHGVLGMQERARSLGGSVRVERAARGGTRVYAVLPMTREATIS